MMKVIMKQRYSAGANLQAYLTMHREDNKHFSLTLFLVSADEHNQTRETSEFELRG